MVDQLINALILCSGYGHHGNTQRRFQRIDLDGAAVYPHLIHHIQGQNHGDSQLNELDGQIEIPLNIRGIENIDDPIRMRFQ